MSDEAVEMAPLLLRPEEAAQMLRVIRTRVFELIRSGELRSVKIGTRAVFRQLRWPSSSPAWTRHEQS